MTARLVVVTGAGGFVCSQISVELAAAGFDVIAVDRTFDDDAASRLGAIRRVTGTLPEALETLNAARPFAVIHGAAITAGPATLGISAAAHVRTNMDLLTGCLAWARHAGAARFVFLSSTGVFCADDGAGTLTEFSPATARGPYSAAKKAGEIVTQGAADASFATLSLRLGNMFGPREAPRPSRPGLGLVARMIAAAKAEGLIRVETPQARRDWTWLPDIGRALAGLLITFPGDLVDVLHCGSTEVLSDLDLAQAIAAVVPGTRVEVAPGPWPAAKGPMGSAITSALNGFHWTPVRAALAGLLQREGVA
ncbi:MAG: NAD-dependent epimerase/dehydratase family protein [Limimaricola sp.]|uniref:NAD-dependent epimerase/dehydratase family protein n=1 Tax=Limimaricola sp. TaxID=2211665 RepID=UPI001DAB1B9C|nr:NAD(P)-dependent oxidoreductase [Limimaricola sp.]MBI1416815.1 NAD-dependent epimerase/dehydratase family protein [Limimaricola sp.]